MHTFIRTGILAYKHTCIQAHFQTCILAYKHLCIYTYMHTYIPVYMYQNILKYLHSCICAYLHTITVVARCVIHQNQRRKMPECSNCKDKFTSNPANKKHQVIKHGYKSKYIRFSLSLWLFHLSIHLVVFLILINWRYYNNWFPMEGPRVSEIEQFLRIFSHKHHKDNSIEF